MSAAPLKTVATSHKFVAQAFVNMDKEPLGKLNISLDAESLKMTKIESEQVSNPEKDEESWETLTFPTQQILAFEEYKAIIELKVIIDYNRCQEL